MNRVVHQFFQFMPERRMELIDGKYVVGNWLAGSRLMLAAILADWDAAAAVALAPLELWRTALRVAYQIPETISSDEDMLEYMESRYAEQEIFYGGSHRRFEEILYLDRLHLDLFTVLRKEKYGRSLGRDFTLRIGEDGLSPREIFIAQENINRLADYYITAPTDLVIEVRPIVDTAPTQELGEELLSCWRSRIKLYEQGGVPECWIVDTEKQQITFLRLYERKYQAVEPDEEGVYRSPLLPGLIFKPAVIWQEKFSENNSEIGAAFEWQEVSLDSADLTNSHRLPEFLAINEEITWDQLPFTPRISLTPEKITFAEYISWAPRSKFERYGEPPQIRIDSREGTRNVLAMLLMTFGAVEAVKLLPPQQWIAAIRSAEADIKNIEQQKAQWWERTRQAAQMLREHFGVERVGIIGDLVRPVPLSIWSNVVLVTWGMGHSIHRAGDMIYERFKKHEWPFDIIDAERTRPSYRHMMAAEMLEI